MALTVAKSWLITYDITCPKRLSRLHRFLVSKATPVQYSVFHFQGTTTQMVNLMNDIEKKIGRASDDVRGYQLPDNLNIDTIGHNNLPLGTHLLSAPEALLMLLQEEDR